MVVLKKLKGSTLMETLVATVLIVLIFMLASMILNTLFSNTIKNSTHGIRNHLNELQYRYHNEQLQLPYSNTHQDWNITMDRFLDQGKPFVEIEAIHSKTEKAISIISNETL